MTALLVITSVLLLASGAVKMRSGIRVGLGVDVLTFVEVLFGMTTFAAGVAGLGAAPGTAWMVPMGVLLVVTSSVAFSVRMRAYRRRRAELEGDRLEVYLNYLHKLDDPASED